MRQGSGLITPRSTSGRGRQLVRWADHAGRRWFEGPHVRQVRTMGSGCSGAAVDMEGLPATARATFHKVYAYLDQQRGHLDYAAYKALGLPLGSGIVESACTWLTNNGSRASGCAE